MKSSNNHTVYMDHAAATPVDQRVLAAMEPFWRENFYNPSSVYLASKEVKKALDEARTSTAHWLGARPSEITFTSGATEANNLAIQGVMKQFPEANIAISAIEHDAVRFPAEQYSCKYIPVDKTGRIDNSAIISSIDDSTVLISVIYGNNEIGVVQDLSDISQSIQKIRADRKAKGNALPLYFHTDAAQAANYLDLHINKLGVDLMTISAGKCYGPKQSGALYVRAGVVLQPLFFGGGQEHGLRSGTESVAQAVGLAKSLEITQKMRSDELHRLSELRKYFVERLSSLHDDLEVLGHRKYTLPNIVDVVIPGLDGERAVMMLDELGVQCATGSACSASSDEASHVVQALGYSEHEASGSIRFSMGRPTTKDDIDFVVEALKQVLVGKNNWL